MERPEAISVSQINLWLTCGLKYRFQYIDRLPRLSSAAAAVLGTAVHAALEWLHKERKAVRDPQLDRLLKVFEADWNAQCLDREIRFGGDDTADRLILKGKELLTEYYYLPPKPIRGAEVSFQIPLVNPATGEVLDVPLRGVIDLIEGEDELVEFKTSQKSWSLADLPDNIQLTAYSYAFETLFGRPPKELRLVNLVRTKNPRIDTHVTDREKSDYERLFHLASEVRRAIETGVFIPNRGCWLCKDCEFEPDCRDWAGNEEVRAS